jgi:hypothetical protein
MRCLDSFLIGYPNRRFAERPDFNCIFILKCLYKSHLRRFLVGCPFPARELSATGAERLPLVYGAQFLLSQTSYHIARILLSPCGRGQGEGASRVCGAKEVMTMIIKRAV